MDVPILAIVAVLVLFILLWIRMYLRGSDTHKAWSQIAARTALVYDRQNDWLGKPVPGWLNGEYRGRKISFAYVTERSYDHEYTDKFIRVWIEIRSTSYGDLSLKEKGLVPRIGNPFKKTVYGDWDEEFESRFDVSSEPETFASRVFSSSDLRLKLVIGPTPSFIVSRVNTGLESRILRINRGVDYWQRVLDNLCDVAEAVEESLV